MTGYDGQNSLDGPLSKQVAKRQFETKFKSKTSGNWSDRDSIVRDPKKYYYLKTSYDFKDPAEDAKHTDVGASSRNDPKIPPVDCKLHERLQNLVRLVCNVDEMAKQMSEVFPFLQILFVDFADKAQSFDSRSVMTPRSCRWVSWPRVLSKMASDFCGSLQK